MTGQAGSADEPNADDFASIRRIREAVEKDLKWKYGIIGVVTGLTLAGAAFQAYKAVTYEAENYFELAKAKSAFYETQMLETIKQAREARSSLEARVDDASRRLLDAKGSFDDDVQAINARISAVKVAIVNLNQGVDAAGKAVKAVSPADTTAAVTQTVKAVEDNVARSESIAQNLRFVVFPHFRQDSADSTGFLQAMKGLLSSKGYAVAGGTAEGQGAVTASEGPRVDYYIDGTRPASDQRGIIDGAQNVADALNTILPSGWRPFVIRQHADAYAAKQTSFLGVWF